MNLSFTHQAELLLNRLLLQDPVAMAALQNIAGKYIAVEFIGPDLTVTVHCHESGVRLSTKNSEKPDVTIRGRPVTYIGLLVQQSRESTGFPREMEITGDVSLAQDFQQIMKNLEIDWEEYLSQRVGDTMAHKLGNLFRDLNRYSKETASTLGMDISEYLRFEKEALPDQSQVDEFIAGVDELRNDVERLRQRIDKLESITRKS